MSELSHLAYAITRQLGGLQIAKALSCNHPKIFMYHRVTDEINENELTVDMFRKHVEIIRKSFYPMTLSQLLVASERGEIPKNAVVITFDDGYSDFATKAFPILREANVPATLFVTTGFVDGELWLWPDQIQYAITSTEMKELKLSRFQGSFDIRNKPKETWSEIANFCLTLTNEKKMSLIDEIFNKLKVPWPRHAPERYQPVSWPQIQEMIAEGLDIGSHTISHPILTKVNDNQLAEELQLSKRRLEVMTGKEINTIAYPNGMPNDFDEKVKIIAKECGYKYGVCAYPSKKPIESSWSVNRYAAGTRLEPFLKTLYGLSYLSLKS